MPLVPMRHLLDHAAEQRTAYFQVRVQVIPFGGSHRVELRVLTLLFVAVLLFYWKILLTSQFSVLLEYEGTNQAYVWDNFAAANIKQGILPLWDPYVHSGRSFVGEMQTGLFYPPNVFGWPGGRTWLTSRSLIGRARFVEAIVSGKVYRSAEPLGCLELASRYGIPGDMESLLDFYCQLLVGMNANNTRDVFHSSDWKSNDRPKQETPRH